MSDEEKAPYQEMTNKDRSGQFDFHTSRVILHTLICYFSSFCVCIRTASFESEEIVQCRKAAVLNFWPLLSQYCHMAIETFRRGAHKKLKCCYLIIIWTKSHFLVTNCPCSISGNLNHPKH